MILAVSLAEKFLEKLEADSRLRKRLTELLVSEPDVRLTLIKAVLTEVAAKQDIRELRSEMSQLRGEVSNEINGLRSEMSQLRTEIGEIRKDVFLLRGEMGSYLQWTIGIIITVWGATVIPILLKQIGAI
ncbi:MAG: hypothetical protein ABWK01_03925 [Infirmifilum sp.]